MWLNRQIVHGWYMDDFGKFNVEYCKFQYKYDMTRKDIEASEEVGRNREDYLRTNQLGFIIKKVWSLAYSGGTKETLGAC